MHCLRSMFTPSMKQKAWGLAKLIIFHHFQSFSVISNDMYLTARNNFYDCVRAKCATSPLQIVETDTGSRSGIYFVSGIYPMTLAKELSADAAVNLAFHICFYPCNECDTLQIIDNFLSAKKYHSLLHKNLCSRLYVSR